MTALPDLSQLDRCIAQYGGAREFQAFLDSWKNQEDVVHLGYDWEFLARPKQLPPPGPWATWMVRCGRGWGKTLTGAQWVRWRVEREGARRIALVGATAADVRDVMVEGPSGILTVSPPWFRPHYEASKRRLTWPNGAVATTYSADEPRSLRGPEHDSAWADELMHWRFLEDAWDNLQFGLRRGDPRCIVTSSPRGLPFLRVLEAESDTITTVGTTHENRNLPPKFKKKILDKYGGTRLGRQEIFAEILTDNPNALWEQKRIDELRVQAMPADFIRVVVAVDPATTAKKKSDETGIICAGTAWCKCRSGRREIHAFVFDDRSGIYKPHEWGKKVVDAYDEYLADLVVAETNQGGDMVERNIRATEGGENIAYKGVHASRGKQIRHEPIANLYTQGKVHHVGRLSRLEDQATQWDPTQGDSPDRLDANTYALTELMLEKVHERGEVRVTVIG